jgi:hypothetical protein
MFRPYYLKRKHHRYLLNSRVVGRRESLDIWREQNSFLLFEIKPGPLGLQACSLVSLSRPLTQVNCLGFLKSKEKRHDGINMKLEVYKKKSWWRFLFKHRINYVLKCYAVQRWRISVGIHHSSCSLSYDKSIAPTKRVLHKVRSRASSFNLERPLFSCSSPVVLYVF